jgi:branched-chain amino acid transport system ATP-binding protein
MLKVLKLEVSYGDAQALGDVSLSVDEGAIVAVVGSNGAGKTSLIRAIAGIVPIKSGSVAYKNQEIAGLSSSSICELGIGQVAEGRQVFPSLTVRENLEIGGMLKRAKAKAKRTMEEVYTLFPRLKERHTQAAGTLSGGEQQMLAIGRCLMGQPELIMFDEPSLGLAPAIVSEVFNVIKDLNRRGITIILVEQNVAASLKLAKHAYVLEHGHVAFDGRGRSLLTDERVRKAYLGL